MPAARSQETIRSEEPSLVDLATCHTSSVDDSHRSLRAASPKSSTMMSTSASHRRMEPFIRPPPMMRDELLNLAIPDVMKPGSYRIPPLHTDQAASIVSSKNLSRLNRMDCPSKLQKLKNKMLTRSCSQRSKNKSSDHRPDPLARNSQPELDWLAQHIHTSSQKSTTAHLSEGRVAAIERWRISVYLTDLLRGI
ncbi:uncharacterized protein VP01_111g8 [Puccinia sorghi]|uniref:Uncharacterized protein n=1 Tax=Puccinia sorghi TaxID=27349 RepID=A0A0L6VSE3_9BASI|nr:uncharacterized protein VP01_111g8 [Puccinia sorghi]